MTTILSSEAPMDELKENATIRIAKLISDPAGTKSPVVAVTSKFDFIAIELIQTAKQTQQTLPAEGILEICTKVPFKILVTKVSKNHDVLHKDLFIALNTGPTECIVGPERNNGLKPTVQVNTLPYKEIEHLQEQTGCHVKL